MRQVRGLKWVKKPGFFFTSSQGEELRKQIGAAAYIECSSKTQQIPWPKPPTKWDDFCVL
ncbi:unnamed protein product [Arabidopsis lyrata]|nr:unnamed protein product [Arabidopsis lyrata]